MTLTVLQKILHTEIYVKERNVSANIKDPYHFKQDLTKPYSLHDLRSVGISYKSEFNTAKMAQFTPFSHGVNLDLTCIRLLW